MNGTPDILVLVGMLCMTPWEYLAGIGLRYIMIPAMIIPAGITAGNAVGQRGRNNPQL